jgi:hypothetical protein
MTQLYDVAKAARLLDIHPQQVRELIWSGQLSWVDVAVGKRPRVRIEHSEIERFIAARSSAKRHTVATAPGRATRKTTGVPRTPAPASAPANPRARGGRGSSSGFAAVAVAAGDDGRRARGARTSRAPAVAVPDRGGEAA